MALASATMFPTVYHVPSVEIVGTLATTNSELGLNPATLRLIRSGALPRPLPSALNVDSGDYPSALDRLKTLFGHEMWRQHQALIPPPMRFRSEPAMPAAARIK
jgi:aerobic carbon-monoxide dehydrogenase large subunit